jgi:hypothetical protein
MTDALTSTRDAILGAIAGKVDSVGTIDDVVKLADAYSKVVFGPQGGDKTDRVDERDRSAGFTA